MGERGRRRRRAAATVAVSASREEGVTMKEKGRGRTFFLPVYWVGRSRESSRHQIAESKYTS
jgi:hypothetical protein